MFKFDSIVKDCKTVEIPPKLITKEHNIVEINLLERVLRDMHPFVISIIPDVKAEMFCGKIAKSGDRLSITMKKIVIIVPTERIDRVEFKTISARLTL